MTKRAGKIAKKGAVKTNAAAQPKLLSGGNPRPARDAQRRRCGYKRGIGLRRRRALLFQPQLKRQW
jgi:hypothetical protein